MKFTASVDSSPCDRFLCSTRCRLTAFYPQQSCSGDEVSPANPAAAFSTQFVFILNLCCHLDRLHSIFTGSRGPEFHKKPLCRSSVRSASSSVTVSSGDRSSWVASSGSTAGPSSRTVATTSAVTSSPEVLNLQSHPRGLESASSKLLLMLTFDLFPRITNVLDGTSMENPSQEVCRILCPAPPEESPPVVATALRNAFLIT